MMLTTRGILDPGSKPIRSARSMQREQCIYSQWVASSAGLPQEGQHVEFVLDGRDVAMEGAYVRQTFQTRWTGYEVDRVRTWRTASFTTLVR